jgi:hypothetical protein
MSRADSAWPLLIPIGVLLIVFLGTGVPYLMIPVFILFCVLVGGLSEEKKIQTTRQEMDHWTRSEPGVYTSGSMSDPTLTVDRPIYDRQKRKDEGIAFGLLIPIFILAFVWYESGFDWPISIPLFILGLIFLSSVAGSIRGRSRVRAELSRASTGTVQDLADRSGLPEDRVRRHIIDEKRAGATDVWFDSRTGEMTTEHKPAEERPSQGACPYCGFALRFEDRFCPYCGAPIKS